MRALFHANAGVIYFDGQQISEHKARMVGREIQRAAIDCRFEDYHLWADLYDQNCRVIELSTAQRMRRMRQGVG